MCVCVRVCNCVCVCVFGAFRHAGGHSRVLHHTLGVKTVIYLSIFIVYLFLRCALVILCHNQHVQGLTECKDEEKV